MTDEEKIHAWDTLEAIVNEHRSAGVEIWGQDDPRDPPQVMIDCFLVRGEGASLNEALYRLKEQLDR